jgi:hypothetical protein
MHGSDSYRGKVARTNFERWNFRDFFFTSRPRIRGYFNFDSRAHRELRPGGTVVSHLCAVQKFGGLDQALSHGGFVFFSLFALVGDGVSLFRKKKGEKGKKNNAGTRRCTWSNTLNAYKHFVETINVGNILFFRRKSRGAQRIKIKKK